MLYEDDSDLNVSMGAFEAALASESVTIEMPKVGAVVLAVDGSNQDATAIALVGAIAKRTGAKVFVTFAPNEPGPGDQAVLDGALAGLREQGVEAEARSAEGEMPSRKILAVREQVHGDLIALPAPYLRDIGLLADESVSSVVDVLMAEASVPLLIVRHPLEDAAKVLDDVLLPVSVYSAEVGLAAGWAFQVMGPSGVLELLAVADRAAVVEAMKLLGENVDPKALTKEALERAEGKEVGGLVAAIQKLGTERGLRVTTDVQSGNAANVIADHGNQRARLLCMGAPSDRTSPAYHRAQDVILRSKNPLLVT